MEEKYVLKILGENVLITSGDGQEHVNDLYNTIIDALDKVEDVDKQSSLQKLLKSLYVSVFLADELVKVKAENKKLEDALSLAEKAPKQNRKNK